MPTRRTFLQTSTAAGVALGTTAIASANAANNKLTVGLIGCGGRGPGVANGMRSGRDVEIAYVCDPDRTRLAARAKQFGVPGERAVTDMRKLLDDKSLDAVIVATCDHWHAPAAIAACEAGKHVYVEKPCSHNFREGQLLVEAARKHKCVVQHGTQSRSSQLIADGIAMLREGIIGDVLVSKAWNVQRRGSIGKAQPEKAPSHVDYDTWVGPAAFLPYQSNRLHYKWHWWRNFGTGDMGNDGVHELDYAVWGLGVDTHPTHIAGLGGKLAYDDDQEFPDTQNIVFEWPGGVGQRKQLIFEMRLWSTSAPHGIDNGVEFYGTKGKMLLTKRGVREVYLDRNQRVPNAAPKEPYPLKESNHQHDFVDAIVEGRQPQADIEIGHRSSALCHLGNIAAQLGRSLQFDAEKQVIVGDEEATRLLSREYRDGGHWAVPQGV